jgi:NAD-dependent deacetylase
MGIPPETVSRLEKLLKKLRATSGMVAVLSGAGISVESGIPTFRRPQGYGRAGSREYRPEQMATLQVFRKDPWEV